MRSGLKNRPIAVKKAVSNLRKFKNISSTKLEELKQVKLKQRTFSKMRAFRQWRSQKLDSLVEFDVKLFESDIDTPAMLTKENFRHSLCMFIPEVTKLKDGSDYPGKTLYEMITSIQKYLNQHKVFWKLIDDPEFLEVRTVLDNVMKERAEQNIGLIKKQAQFISMEHEQELWEKGILREENADKLSSTILFLIGVNVGLRAGDKHYCLRRDSKEKKSQLSFERAPNGKRCLVYREDNITKTNDGGVGSLKKDRKEVWIYPNVNVTRCTVRLVDKYISLLPPVSTKTKKLNFYLCSLEKRNPAQWYGESVVGCHTLCQVVKNLLKDAKLDGYFTNHSLRRTGTTHLFQAGVDRKIIKEYTGHVSDAVDKYQATSHAQREHVSKVLSGNFDDKVVNIDAEKDTKETNRDIEVNVCSGKSVNIPTKECNFGQNSVKLSKGQDLGDMINKILAGKHSNKTKIKLEIEFCD